MIKIYYAIDFEFIVVRSKIFTCNNCFNINQFTLNTDVMIVTTYNKLLSLNKQKCFETPFSYLI